MGKTASDSKTIGGTGRLFIISAPSGAGKTTLCKRLLQRFPEMRYSVSHTTRTPRSGEINGEDYHFISTDRFERMIHENRWAEWARVHGNYYGTSADRLKSHLEAGYDVLLDIDVAGARQIRERFPQSIHIFIMPPSMSVLRRRLSQRSSDKPEDIEKRMEAAEMEMAHRDEYDHVIVNDDLEAADKQLAALIAGYRDSNANIQPDQSPFSQ